VWEKGAPFLTVFSEIREESIAVCSVHLFMANACLSHKRVRGGRHIVTGSVCMSCGVNMSVNAFIMCALYIAGN